MPCNKTILVAHDASCRDLWRCISLTCIWMYSSFVRLCQNVMQYSQMSCTGCRLIPSVFVHRQYGRASKWAGSEHAPITISMKRQISCAASALTAAWVQKAGQQQQNMPIPTEEHRIPLWIQQTGDWAKDCPAAGVDKTTHLGGTEWAVSSEKSEPLDIMNIQCQLIWESLKGLDPFWWIPNRLR